MKSFIFCFFLLIVLSCSKTSNQNNQARINISSAPATSITPTTAVVGGTINSEGMSPIIQRGVCYSTTPLPTIRNIIVPIGGGLGSFQTTLQNLIPETRYYFRAYAYNSTDTAYGGHLEFTTSALLPIVQTNNISAITTAIATCSAKVIASGASAVIARGVCWSTNAGPTINDSKTVDGSGTGDFTSSITGLRQNTTYFLRAYATNSQGTAYGNELSFATPLPTTANLNHIQFLDNSIGFIAGEGVLLKTTSGGNSWSVINQNSTINFTSIFFLNPSVGYAGGNDQYYAYIFKTTDGGITWTQLDRWWSGNDLMRINGIHAADANRVTCLLSIRSNSSVHGSFYTSSNGGASWTGQYLNFKGLNCGDLFNGNLYIGGNYYSTGSGAGSYVYISSFHTNGSTALSPFQVPGVFINIYSIQMLSTYGFAVGDEGRILQSESSGQNWTMRSIPGYAAETFYGVRFGTSLKGFIVGTNGIILRTIDGGVNWFRENSNTTKTFRGIALKPDGTLFAVGASGEIYRNQF